MFLEEKGGVGIDDTLKVSTEFGVRNETGQFVHLGRDTNRT